MRTLQFSLTPATATHECCHDRRVPDLFAGQAAECATACACLPPRDKKKTTKHSTNYTAADLLGTGAAPRQSERQASTVRPARPPIPRWQSSVGNQRRALTISATSIVVRAARPPTPRQTKAVFRHGRPPNHMPSGTRFAGHPRRYVATFSWRSSLSPPRAHSAHSTLFQAPESDQDAASTPLTST
jgi:hypothetical protein